MDPNPQGQGHLLNIRIQIRVPDLLFYYLVFIFLMTTHFLNFQVEASQVVDVLRACDLNPLSTEVNKILKDSDLLQKRVDIETFCSIYEQIKSAPGQACFEVKNHSMRSYK